MNQFNMPEDGAPDEEQEVLDQLIAYTGKKHLQRGDLTSGYTRLADT